MQTIPRRGAPLLACAALTLAAGAAAAQSSVTIYGRIDLGVRYGPADLLKSEDRMWAVEDSSTGRIGFRGVEDLGGGVSAFFQLEHRLKADTGMVDGGVFWKDKAWVGLASKTLGSVQLGRMSSPQDNLGVNGRFEAFGGDSYASNGSRGAKSAAKWDNTVYYTTPFLSGFTAGVAVAAGEGTRKRAQGFHLDYANGPLVLATTFQTEQDPVSGAPSGNGIRTVTLGGSYQFGFAKPSFTYARSTDLGASDEGKETVWTVGARIPAGPGELRVSFRRIDGDRVNGSTHAADRKSHRLGVGYQYFLSKRSTLNLSLVNDQVKTFNANGSTKTDFSGNGFELALRHNF